MPVGTKSLPTLAGVITNASPEQIEAFLEVIDGVWLTITEFVLAVAVVMHVPLVTTTVYEPAAEVVAFEIIEFCDVAE